MTSNLLGEVTSIMHNLDPPKILASRRHTLFIRCISDGDMAGGKGGACAAMHDSSTREKSRPPSSNMFDSNGIPGLTPFDHHVLASRYRSLQLRHHSYYA